MNTNPLYAFIGLQQLQAIAQGSAGEEGEYFEQLTAKIQHTIDTMPKTYETDGQGDQAVAHLHYFQGGMDWYITERDSTPEQHQAFGSANLGYGAELGYISIQELIQNGIELDLHFKPCTLASIAMQS